MYITKVVANLMQFTLIAYTVKPALVTKSLKIDPEFHKSSLILADQSGVLTRTIHILIAVLAYTGHIYTSCQMFYQQ
jgi:hypothetical protein